MFILIFNLVIFYICINDNINKNYYSYRVTSFNKLIIKKLEIKLNPYRFTKFHFHNPVSTKFLNLFISKSLFEVSNLLIDL